MVLKSSEKNNFHNIRQYSNFLIPLQGVFLQLPLWPDWGIASSHKIVRCFYININHRIQLCALFINIKY